MARRALILTAGTLLTIVTSAHPAAAISPRQQSTVTNNQAQQGLVVVDNTLNVVDVWTNVSQTTAATGNTFSGSAVSAGLNVVSSQALTGNVDAAARMNVDGRSGDMTVQSTAATGNDGESNIYNDHMVARSTQTVGAVSITALGEYNGGQGETSSLTNTTQAVANSQGYGVSNASAVYTVNQSSAALTQADGGGTLGFTDGTALFSALATSNNVTGTGSSDGSEQTANVTQRMTGTRTQATVFANVGTGQDLVAQSTATANNISITNVDGPLSVVSNQTNDSYLQSQAVLTAYEFGSAQTNAYGVGNSVMAGNIGQSVDVNNTQSNSGGGVEVSASFTGGGGYDAYVASTAIGNAVTGFACTTCGGRMTVTNRQTNTADVGSTAVTSIAGYNRSTTATATATGNSASFYVSNPTGN